MKKHLLFNQSFGTEGSPNQTGETQTRENRIGLMSYLHRTLMLLLVAYIGIGNVWGQTKVTTSNFYKLYSTSKDDCSTLVTNASFPSYAGNTFNANMNGTLSSVPSISTPHNFAGLNTTDKYYRIKMASKKTLTLTNVANVKKVTFYGNGSSSTRTISVSVAKVSGSGSTFSVTPLSLANSNATIVAYATEDFTGKSGYDANTYYTYTFTADGDVSLWGVYVECGATTSYRTFKSGEKIYFKDQESNFDFDALWKVSSGNVYAYFWNDTENAWSSYGDLVEGSWNAANAIYEITVPGSGKEYTKVLFTRGNGAAWGNTWDKTEDQTPAEGKNLFYVYKTKYADHIYKGAWGNFTPAGKTVYFDNRNVSTWTTAYVRIGHGSNNSAWGAMTKVAGTKYLYSQSTSKYASHTDFAIANKAGWTGGNHIDQPEKTYSDGSWSGSEYKMTMQTNYQQYAIDSDMYICPKATSVLEHECQYYQVTNANSTTTSRIDDKTIGLRLPSYTVTSSGTNCTVSMVKYTADDFSTSSALASGGTVMPTQYIGVTVSPTTGYKFSSVSLTTGKYEQHTAAAAGVTGKYAILGDCEVSATCVAKTCTVSFDNNSGTGGTNTVTATYDADMPSKASNLPTRTGYTFAGYYDSETDNDGTGTKYYNANGTSAKKWNKDTESNTTLYAKWTLNSHTLTWNFAGGSTSATAGTNYTAPGSVSYGTALTYPANNTMSKDYHTFSGWSSTPSTMPDNDLTITAQWTANQYSVTHTLSNVTTSSGATGANAATYGTDYTATFAASSGYTLPATITVTIGGAATTHYTWNSSTGAVVVDGAYITGNIVITVTGVSAGPTYTVTYTYNGATGGNSTESSTQTSSGASVTLPTPTKTNYTFQGWYESGGTKAGNGGATYEPEADITLYALWRESCAGGGGNKTLVDINFKDASWTGKTFSQANDNNEDLINGVYFWSKNSDKHFSLADNTSKGLTFPNNNMSSGNYYFCIPITGINSSDKQITVTLKHGYSSSKATYKYVYIDGRTTFVDGNTNSSGGESVSDAANADTQMSFTKGSLSNTSGHLIIGRGGSDFTRIYGVTVTTPSNATCYYVTYNGNGATGGFMADETAHGSGDNVAILENTYTRTGYTFTGWKTEPSGGTSYEPEGTITAISSDITLYAQWAAGTLYSVTYNGNGATSGSVPVDASSPYASGANVTVLGNTGTLALANYTFDGWATVNDGTGTSYTADGTISGIAADVELFAKWKQTVTLNTGSQGSGEDKTPYIYINGAALNGFSAHSAAGYTLNGYYSAASGGTKVLEADGSFAATDVANYVTGGKWSRSDATTLYAQWRAAGGASCNTIDHISDFPSSGSTGMTVGNLKVTFGGSKTSRVNDRTIYSGQTNRPTLKIGGNGPDNYVQGYLGGNEISSLELGVSESTAYAVAFSASSTFDNASVLSWSAVNSQYTPNATSATSDTLKNITVPSGAKYFRIYRKVSFNSIELGAGSSVYVWHIKACTAGASTHTISYNNGGGSGTMTSDASIADDGSKAIKTNTFTAPSNFAFAGWVADVDVTISGNTVTAGTLIANGATITNITTDIALTAKWSQTITLDKNSSNHGTGDNGSATVYYNATELASITHTTPASGYKLVGYYTAATEGTKVLNGDGTFAGTAVTGYITDGKWTQSSTSTPTLHAQYELAGGIVTNTLKVGANKWGSSISTSEPTLITSLNALAAVGGLTIENANGTTASGTALTCKIEASGATSKTDSKYLQLSFTIATGYKLNVTGIGMTVRSVSMAGKYHIELAGTTGSLTPDDETVGSGSIAAIFDDTYNQDFTGTVTLKLWAYGKDGSNLMSEYRLANPITIYGTLIETCTMPSYSSVTYTKTEYTVSETSSAITVTSPSDVTSYQWKYNSTGDRTSGTNADAVGTGATTASFTPSTSVAHEKRYYWCELTNACGTIKTEAVGVTVSTSKSTATVTWSNPGTVNYGGGGYTLRATVDQTGWDGNAADLVITAPAGINIYGVTSGTDGSSQKYVEVTFDVQTSFDRSTYAENIPFTVSAAATTNYNAISNEHNVAYVACSGGGGEGSAFIEVTSGVTTAKSGMSNYWEAAGVGRLNKAYNQSMGSSADAQTIEGHAFSYRTGANNSNWMVNTYIAGVTKIRLYFYASAEIKSGKLGISKVLYDTEYFSSQGDRSVVFSNVETSAASYAAADKGWIEFELPEMAANSYCYFATNTGNLYIYGVELFSESVGSGGTLNTHLQWSGLADGDIVSKSTNDAYFTYSASKITENMNTLGAITYSSSAPSVATVDATGKVSMVAAGSTTIKATLAASGCYKKAEISYTLNVSEPVCSIAAGTLELTSGSETKCEGNEVTLTLTGFESGATLQWKDGDTDVNHNGSTYKIARAGTTSTLTTNQPGTYSVIVHDVTNDCDVRSNRITISNKSTSVSAERDVKTWYIKKGRLTPPIELWSLSEGTHLSSVAWSPANATGLSGEDLFFEQDDKVYMQGTAPTADNSTGSDIAYTLTLTVKDECNNTTTLSASDKQITLYHQKNTDKHVVAFVVTGTEKGGFTEGVPSNQTTEIDLYKAIAAEFDVVATNVYSTDDEQEIKEYYSQFDILCVTDYPDTNTKGAKKQSYVNALGSLIDIRPILTMEAFVAKWSNWAAKGISGTPKSPDPKQYAMDLQCKDHEIFDGTDWSTVGAGDEMMYRVTMVSSTSYPSKPALQGFTFDATMVADGLLPLGQIYNGSTETLQVGIERQNEMAARLMVLGINSVAMERLTDNGQRVVINALKYLMKKNEEEIADCSVSFVGGAEEGSKTDWNNDANWSTGKRPDKTTREVRILAPCVITDGQTITSPTIKIADGGTYDGGTTANGKLTINAGGVLKVKGEVVGVTAPAYSKKKATEASRLELETSASKQSALILDNEEGLTRATVNMYSLGRKVSETYQFQYMAIPMEYVDVNPAFAGSGIYTYVWHEASGWERRGYYAGLYAFEGVGITTKFAAPKTYRMTGTLASTETKEITLTAEADGYNLIGNSWTAPIQISKLEADNSSLSNKTVYIYNTGNDDTADEGYGTGAGQWSAIPFNAAGFGAWSGLKVIPAMQAFEIVPASEETLTLNYDTVVRGDNKTLTEPLHTPRRNADHASIELMRIRVADSKSHTDLHLFEGERFSDEFDNGWEAAYMDGDDGTTKLYADVALGRMAVLATDLLEGTILGFAPGQEMDYTFSFGGAGMGYYLNDLKLKVATPINEAETYTFTFEEGDTNRFYISKTRIDAPEIATGVDNTSDGVKAQKILYNDKLYIIVNGRVYSAIGGVVR